MAKLKYMVKIELCNIRSLNELLIFHFLILSYMTVVMVYIAIKKHIIHAYETDDSACFLVILDAVEFNVERRV